MDGSDSVMMNKTRSMPTLPILRENIATVSDCSRYAHLRDLPIFTPPNVDGAGLLIGLDCPEALEPLELASGVRGQPYGVRTRLGWSLSGPINETGGTHETSTNFIVTRGVSTSPAPLSPTRDPRPAPSSHAQDQQLSEQVARFWELESSGLYDTTKGPSQQDQAVLRRWEKEVKVVDGHYQLPIPFKDEKPRLPDARNMAEKRLKNLKRKLEANPTLRQQYIDGIQSLLDKGHAIEVPAESADKRSGIVWYLPHHPVINPNKDKPRIVFDCAARQGVTSLNSQVCSGPDLNNSLVGVLLRFRRHLVAFMGDVEAMFHQVKVDPDQQDALRFLWWPDGDMTGTPKPYKMTVHLFGGTWSPSVCAFALQRTAKEGQADFHPETIKAVERSFYVDDCLQSVATEEEAILQVQELGQLLGRRGFTIRKWVANSPRVLESVPEADRSKQVRERSIDSPLEERALGVYWSVESDCFSYKVREMEKPLTKRGLLSMLSSVYDPLGFAGPFILKARLIVQDLCRHGFEWDEAIPEEYEEQWQQWIAALPEMKAVKVPRCLQPPPDAEAATTSDGRSDKGRERSDIVVGPGPTLIHSAPVQPRSDTVTERRLHHFADASQIAYGVVSYLRTEYASGRVTVALTMAKSRLAPIKATTIPRLELCAATLATRQDELLRRELDLELSPSQYWSDSTIVLWYVSHEEKRFQTFVANRVSEIRGRSEPTQWRHVPTDENPADDASRGTSPAELTGRRWLEGPAFLKQPSEEWPVWEPSQPVDKEQLELRKEKVCMAVVGVPVDPIDTLLGR